jgi:hypothetical protein
VNSKGVRGNSQSESVDLRGKREKKKERITHRFLAVSSTKVERVTRSPAWPTGVGSRFAANGAGHGRKSGGERKERREEQGQRKTRIVAHDDGTY